MNKTGIQWADLTFNPIVGCTAGCEYCYARRVAQRLSCPQCQAYRPHFHPERLQQLSQGKPGRVFMGSMGDMFDPKVDPDWWRQILLAYCASGCRHKLMVLTKRPDMISSLLPQGDVYGWTSKIWFGVTVTRQADEWRIKHLLEVPAAGHFVSLEPLLRPVDFEDIGYVCSRCAGTGVLPDGDGCGLCHSTGFRGMAIEYLEWLIMGGLSGSWLPDGLTSKADFHCVEAIWANQIIKQAKAAGVPVFVKTKPVKLPGVEVIQEWPSGLEE